MLEMMAIDEGEKMDCEKKTKKVKKIKKAKTKSKDGKKRRIKWAITYDKFYYWFFYIHNINS